MIQTKNKYFYNDGFIYKAYICSNCGSRKMTRHIQGGFSPPTYSCDDCSVEMGSPVWENITDAEKVELGIVDELISPEVALSLEKYNANLAENNDILTEVNITFAPKINKAIANKDIETLVRIYQAIESLPLEITKIIYDAILSLKLTKSKI